MRVGCYPCIMCRHSEIKNMAKTNPDYIERLKEAENKVGRTFFPPDFIPGWATQNVDQATNKKINTVIDVVNYIDNKNATIDMFDDDGEDRSCMSYYGLCE
jgi:V8-like Glu-specific endopeptidase